MSVADTEAVTLHFTPHLRVAGEVLEGEVHLNFPILRKDGVEEVHVKLRGSVFTKITRNFGKSTVTRTQRVAVVKENISVWTQGSAFPPPESHILVLPFRFELPRELLPSCKKSGFTRSATVGYSLQVVGVRPGILNLNRRGQVAFPVLPFDLKGAEVSHSLKQGWDGPWRPIHKESKIRKGIFGSYSEVKLTLQLPDIDFFPVFTDIPFTLNVVTTTKPMKKEDTPEEDGSIFPAPPTTPSQVEFRLNRDVFIKVHSWTTTAKGKRVAYLGGLGPAKDSKLQHYDQIRVEPKEKEWIPDMSGEKGVWKQEVTFSSMFRLTSPPTFESKTMTLNYFMEMVVPFSGIGNDLRCNFPVRLVSSMPDPTTGTQWDGPPPELDLPPEYFSGATDWNHDERDADEKG